MKFLVYIIYLIILTILGNLLYYYINKEKIKGYFIYSLVNFAFYVFVGYLCFG